MRLEEKCATLDSYCKEHNSALDSAAYRWERFEKKQKSTERDGKFTADQS